MARRDTRRSVITMSMDLASAGFAFEAEWYWRIFEGDDGFDAASARGVLLPISRLAGQQFTLDEISADDEARVVRFHLAGEPVQIAMSSSRARIAADRFVIDLNRHLAGVDHAFVLVVPRRYQLRGVLLSRAALAEHARDPRMIMPSDRRLAHGTLDR